MARKRKRAKIKQGEPIPESGSALAKKDVEQTPVVSKAEDKKSEAKAAQPKATAKSSPSAGQKMGSFFKDVRAEMKKVSWPDQERTTESTGVVIATLIFLAGCMTLFTMVCTVFADYFFGTATTP